MEIAEGLKTHVEAMRAGPAPYRETVGERILRFLQSLDVEGLTSEDVWPLEASQGGIAEHIGVSRSHAALELKRLIGRGRVAVSLAHVRGGKARLQVYKPWEGNLEIHEPTGQLVSYAVAEVREMKFASCRCPRCGSVIRVALRD